MVRVGINAQNQARCIFGDAAPDEVVYVYILRGNASTGFWDGRDDKGRRVGGTMVMANYQILEVQPSPSILCSKEKWEGWCGAHKAELMAIHQATLTPPAPRTPAPENVKVARPSM